MAVPRARAWPKRRRATWPHAPWTASCRRFRRLAPAPRPVAVACRPERPRLRRRRPMAVRRARPWSRLSRATWPPAPWTASCRRGQGGRRARKRAARASSNSRARCCGARNMAARRAPCWSKCSLATPCPAPWTVSFPPFPSSPPATSSVAVARKPLRRPSSRRPRLAVPRARRWPRCRRATPTCARLPWWTASWATGLALAPARARVAAARRCDE